MYALDATMSSGEAESRSDHRTITELCRIRVQLIIPPPSQGLNLLSSHEETPLSHFLSDTKLQRFTFGHISTPHLVGTHAPANLLSPARQKKFLKPGHFHSPPLNERLRIFT